MEKNIEELEQKIGYKFVNKNLLKHAMRHSSYTNEKQLPKSECNERLEFLGDAVLELVSSEFLFFADEEMPEGELTKSREIDLGEYLILGKGEEATGGRKRDSLTSDALEALIGAIYIDGGFANAKEFIMKFVLNDLENKKLFFDSKTILQEIVQSEYKEGIRYEMIGESGPDHNKIFQYAVYIGEEKFGIGTGRTKKAAEQSAAYESILKLRAKNKK